MTQEQEVNLDDTLERFGLNVIPTYETKLIPLDQLVVEEGQGSGSVRKTMVNNMRTVGVLQNLLVIEREDGKYTVVSGNRRLMNAREVGISELECHVYPIGTDPKYVHIMRLSENMKRSPNWPGQVASLSSLVKEGIGMTHKEVAKVLGISVKTLRPLLKMAELPRPFIYEMQAGRLSKDLALKITNLSEEDRADLQDRLVRLGEVITAESIKKKRMSTFASQHGDLIEQIQTPLESLQVVTTIGEPNWQEVENSLESIGQYARNRADRPSRIILTLVEQLKNQLETLKVKEIEVVE